MALESADEAVKQASVLLVHGGQTIADGEECVGPLGRAKAARDLLAHLAHAQRLFGEVVAEGRARIGHEAPDCRRRQPSLALTTIASVA